MTGGKRAMLVTLVIVALLAAALLVASCGSGGGTAGTTGTTPTLTKNAQINEYLNQLDQQMNSVNDSDMYENQLSNQSLGF